MDICLDQGLPSHRLLILVPAYPGCPEKRPLNRCLPVCLFAVGLSLVHSAEMLFSFVYNYLFPVFEMAVCCFCRVEGSAYEHLYLLALTRYLSGTTLKVG